MTVDDIFDALYLQAKDEVGLSKLRDRVLMDESVNCLSFGKEGIKPVEFVKVVRCKDCKHLMIYNDGTYDCKYLVERMFAEGELNNKPNDFCCWGERKDEVDDG